MATVTCPHCGHANPLTSHFCSSCGVDLEVPAEHSTTMSVLVPIDSPAEEVQIELDGLPPGVGMLVVTRGHNSGSRFALDEPVVTAGRHPDSVIFLDDITVSRRHAEIRQVPGGRLRGGRRRVPQRHLPQPGAGRGESRSLTATSSRSAPSSCSSSPAGRDLRHGRPLPPVHRRGPQPAPGRLPRRHDLQDPLPREPGPPRPRAHAVGVPEVLRGRHRAAALDPAPAAGALPPAEGHQGPPPGERGDGPRGAARRAPARPWCSGAEPDPSLSRPVVDPPQRLDADLRRT